MGPTLRSYRLWRIEMDRPRLPIVDYRDEILTAVRDHQVVIVAAETGAGKSTQVPQFLLQAGYGHVVITQPRRLGAPTVDRMIVGEMDQHRAEVSRLTVLRAMHLRQAYGSDRGAAAAAARDLGCSHETARRALAAGEEYTERVREAVRKAAAI
jgi:hypothetical protein